MMNCRGATPWAPLRGRPLVAARATRGSLGVAPLQLSLERQDNEDCNHWRYRIYWQASG